MFAENAPDHLCITGPKYEEALGKVLLDWEEHYVTVRDYSISIQIPLYFASKLVKTHGKWMHVFKPTAHNAILYDPEELDQLFAKFGPHKELVPEWTAKKLLGFTKKRFPKPVVTICGFMFFDRREVEMIRCDMLIKSLENITKGSRRGSSAWRNYPKKLDVGSIMKNENKEVA